MQNMSLNWKGSDWKMLLPFPSTSFHVNGFLTLITTEIKKSN